MASPGDEEGRDSGTGSAAAYLSPSALEAARDGYQSDMERLVSTSSPTAPSGGPGLSGAIPVAPGLEHPVMLQRRGPVRFCDHRGSPLGCEPYLLVIAGRATTAVTDLAGWMGDVDASADSADIYFARGAFHLVFQAPSGDVSKAQSALNALGFSAGPVDGELGLRTHVALSSYQATRALPVTGQPDDATLAALVREHLVGAAGEG